MGVTTRAAAARKAEAEATNLLDLPDDLLERIMLDASEGGQWFYLQNASRACPRLRAAADAATRAATLHISPSTRDDGLARLTMLPRLDALTRAHLLVGYGALHGLIEDDRGLFAFDADRIAQAVVK
jgi:hypothetical protein